MHTKTKKITALWIGFLLFGIILSACRQAEPELYGGAHIGPVNRVLCAKQCEVRKIFYTHLLTIMRRFSY